MALTLRVLTYGKQAPSAPMEHQFDVLGGNIGRAVDNSFVLPDESKFISRHHCRIDYSSSERCFTLTDLGGNASQVAGQAVGHGKSARLKHGDVVAIGDYQLQVVEDGGPGGAAAAPDPFPYQPTPSQQTMPGGVGLFDAPPPGSLAQFADPLANASILDVGTAQRGDPLGFNSPFGGDPLGGIGSPLGGAPSSYRGSEPDHLAGQHMPFSMPIAATPQSAPAAIPPGNFMASPAAPAAGGMLIPDDFDWLAPAAPAPAAPVYEPAAPVYAPAAPVYAPAAPAYAPAPTLAPDFDPLGGSPLGSTGAASTLGNDFDPLGGDFDPLAGPAPVAARSAPQTVAPAPLSTPPATLGADFDPLGATVMTPRAGPVAAPVAPAQAPVREPVVPPPANVPAATVPVAPATVAQAPLAPLPVVPAPAARTPAPRAAAPAAPATQTVASTAATTSAADGAVMQALLNGLGLPDLKTKLSDADLAELVGRMLRGAVGGTMEVLLARSMTKREIRIEATMLAQKGNNPMKFFPDPEQALTQMLTNAWAGYLPGVKAVNDAFDDLKAHELATIAGMRAALAGVLARFDPEEIEARLAVPTVMDKMLASNRKAKMWDQMVGLYRQMSSEADDDFQRLFGEKFAQAYEEQCNRLRMTRK
jgi:type VI secretion system FHA domain protein